MYKHTITAEIFTSSEFPEWLTAFQEFLRDGGEHGTAVLVSTEEVPDEEEEEDEDPDLIEEEDKNDGGL